MPLASRFIRALQGPLQRLPALRAGLKRADQALGRLHHRVGARFPAVIRPAPRQITIAVTAACNLRCQACHYGRGFMDGERLTLAEVRDLLADARAAGVHRARFYGGEPLLHPDLPAMVAAARERGLDAYVTTNGTLLERRIDDLVAAGLQWLTLGFYGIGDAYDAYTGRPGAFARLAASLDAVRRRHGDRLAIQMNFLLQRQTCDVQAVRDAWAFARRFDLHFNVDPVSETIPFFRDPPAAMRFGEDDRPRLQAVSDELLRCKAARPERVPPSAELLRALPDLLLGRLRVPCDAYQLLWVGADGSVQLCDTAFPLGNLRQTRLRDMLFDRTHRQAARDAFCLRCPHCFCKIDSRVRRHGPTMRRYGRTAGRREDGHGC